MKNYLFLLIAGAMLLCNQAMAREFHVSKTGSDANEGTMEAPFKTISKAAAILRSGDTVTVHAGTYREWVNPRNAGMNKGSRILYRAAQGEEVWIKGSEEVKNWKREKGTNVWKAVVSNSIFGDFNPFAEELMGDWLTRTRITYHLGEVYLNNKSLYEVESVEKLTKPEIDERSKNPDQSLYQWYAEVGEKETTIWANFQGYDPNKELVEINVRPACFFPKEQGVNYIAVQGFKLSQAATQWAPPTAKQTGLIGPNWSKGWLIENNEISNSKCTGLSLGKERASGENLWTIERTLSGFNRELEAIFKAVNMGWNKDNIGSHHIRGNEIFDCEQTGICGHLGSVFSIIEDNYIHDINAKRQFTGAELGCIKLHAAIDVIIRNNYFDNGYNGLWLDWQAMGTRVSGNVFINNDHWDLWTEVTHGPCLVDNNIMLSPNGFFDWGQGVAMAHNFIAGEMHLRFPGDRYTPYHVPHSTAVAGVMSFPQGDNRYYNNIFTVHPESTLENKQAGLSIYDSRPAYYEGIYREMNTRPYVPPQQQAQQSTVVAMQEGNRQSQRFQLAMYVNSNLYYNDVKPYAHETINITSSFEVNPVVEHRGDEIILKFKLDDSINKLQTTPVNTAMLGVTYYSNGFYENPDGTPITIDKDFFGNTRSLTNPKVGPFENAKTGEQEIVIWKKK